MVVETTGQNEEEWYHEISSLYYVVSENEPVSIFQKIIDEQKRLTLNLYVITYQKAIIVFSWKYALLSDAKQGYSRDAERYPHDLLIPRA